MPIQGESAQSINLEGKRNVKYLMKVSNCCVEHFLAIEHTRVAVVQTLHSRAQAFTSSVVTKDKENGPFFSGWLPGHFYLTEIHYLVSALPWTSISYILHNDLIHQSTTAVAANNLPDQCSGLVTEVLTPVALAHECCVPIPLKLHMVTLVNTTTPIGYGEFSQQS